MNRADMIYDLSSIWATVKEEFPYFDRLPFDWDEKYHSYLEKILEVQEEADFHELLFEFMDSLKDGHTRYIPPAAFRKSKPFVPPEAPSYTVSDHILTIKINEFLYDHTSYVEELLKSNPDSELVVLDIRDNIGGNTFYAAKVAELFISGIFYGCQKWTQIHKANDFAGASQIVGYSDERIQKYIRDGLLKEADIEDARQEANRTKYESYTDSYGTENHIALYQGPLHLLISKRTQSAAEDFTAMLKCSGRAMLIGEPTGGSTGTPCMIHLRSGGYAQVVSVGYRLADGTEFIGQGIKPDVYSNEGNVNE